MENTNNWEMNNQGNQILREGPREPRQGPRASPKPGPKPHPYGITGPTEAQRPHEHRLMQSLDFIPRALRKNVKPEP